MRHSKEEIKGAKESIETFKCEACGKGHCSAEALRKHRSRLHKPVPKPVAEEPDLDAAS